MAIVQGTAKVNNVAYDFSHGEVGIDIVQMVGSQLVLVRSLPIADGVEEVNYKPTIERAKMYGSSRKPLDRTEGTVDFEASITMQMYWWRYIIDVANEVGIGIANLELNISYMLYRDRGQNSPLHLDILYRTAIKSPEAAFKRGPDTLMVPVALDPMNIYFDGVDMYGETIA